MSKQRAVFFSLVVGISAIVLISCATVNEVKKYTLDLRAEDGGTTSPAPGKHSYDSGSKITIEASPAAGYSFGGWIGAAAGTTNPITITMDADKTLTAHFVKQYVLTIEAGPGGTTDPPPGAYIYDSGSQITLEASPRLGYGFRIWSGDASGTNAVVSISMTSDRTVRAEFALKQEERTGTLSVVPGSTLQPSQLNAITLFGAWGLDQNGSFLVKSNPADRYQIIFFVSKITGNPAYLGLYDPGNSQVTASLESTALALTLINPYIGYADQTQRAQFAAAVQQNPKFRQLLQALTDAYRSDAELALDYGTNPGIYQLVAQLIKEAFSTLGGQPLKRLAALTLETPTISDVPGSGIIFVNPRHIFYGAGVSGGRTDVATVQRRDSILSWNWGWPPIVLTEAKETPYDLGDGEFEIFLTKSLDFSQIFRWDDPKGRATLCNMAQSFLFILDLVLGFSPGVYPELNLADLCLYLAVTPEDQQRLGKAIKAFDVLDLILNIGDVLADNSEEIAYRIFQEYQTNAYHSLISNVARIVSNVSFAFKLLGLANEQAPFFYDLIFADDVTYYIRQVNGQITTIEENRPPVPAFTISPAAGVVGTVFHFDASGSTDDQTSVADLVFRWDWETDGTWDTDWSGAAIADHSYADRGSYLASLEIKDSRGLTAYIAHSISVGGGGGAATHVKLFRDVLPWNSDATITVLRLLGFTEGTGPHTFEIIPSVEMSAAVLDPQEDLVIISNDQTQTFYNYYAVNQLRFSNFVYMGGSLFWEACDEGWNGGSIAAAGILLPGNVAAELDIDYWNYITNLDLPLVSGLPVAMDHNYASHEKFSGFPDGTTSYCVNEQNEPTLIEFNLGNGWIIMTGQPLEHQYERIYGASDMEYLLPRIIAYFTGLPAPAVPMKFQSLKLPPLPSAVQR